jgi:hypothetical protein
MKKKGGGKRRGKEKGEKGKEKEKRKKKKENKGRKIEKGFRKLGEFLGKLGEGFLRIFLGFSDTDVNSGTAVMARQTSRRDRGGAGFRRGGRPRCWCGTHGRWPGCRRCRRNSRHVRRGIKNRLGFRKGVNELSEKVLKTHVIY